MPSIDPGRLDRRITLQSRTTSRDGEGSAIVAFADEDTIWAQKLSETSSEGRRLLAVRAEATIVFRIRYRSSLTSQHRIYFGGRYYDIVGDPVEEGFRETLLVTARYTEGAAA